MSRTIRRRKAKNFKHSWLKREAYELNENNEVCFRQRFDAQLVKVQDLCWFHRLKHLKKNPTLDELSVHSKRFFHGESFGIGVLPGEKKFWKKFSSKKERAAYKHMLVGDQEAIYEAKRLITDTVESIRLLRQQEAFALKRLNTLTGHVQLASESGQYAKLFGVLEKARTASGSVVMRWEDVPVEVLEAAKRYKAKMTSKPAPVDKKAAKK
jgi:hypothetical protein